MEPNINPTEPGGALPPFDNTVDAYVAQARVALARASFPLYINEQLRDDRRADGIRHDAELAIAAALLGLVAQGELVVKELKQLRAAAFDQAKHTERIASVAEAPYEVSEVRP